MVLNSTSKYKQSQEDRQQRRHEWNRNWITISNLIKLRKWTKKEINHFLERPIVTIYNNREVLAHPLQMISQIEQSSEYQQFNHKPLEKVSKSSCSTENSLKKAEKVLKKTPSIKRKVRYLLPVVRFDKILPVSKYDELLRKCRKNNDSKS
ncbi:hypothetical protein ABLA30_22370 [Xenorhabdus nematophila]|uniref:hypothetical protein n=1 Tax=Xenorhabdus nematophila TaxID=628 RepID=UPI0003275734|nr:hypothetical protein [Xenorhabdus nematophila]CCW28971.1 hypothetical protein XNC3_1060024 [Xenorhabdus nematophila F1]